MEREYLDNKLIIKNRNEIENKKIGLWFLFECKSCGSIKERRIGSSTMSDFNFKCSSCNRKETNLKKFGVENPFQNEKVKTKIKQFFLKNYGVEYPNQVQSIRQKIESTRILKYGERKEKIVEKTKTTWIEKYGVDNPQKCEKIRKKTEKTNLEKYGHKIAYAYNSPEMKQLLMEKYGVEYPLQNSEIRKKLVKRYFYDKNYFDSSYELIFYKWLQENCIKFEYQPFHQHLYYNGHHYTPDFFVNDEYIEIKGEHFFKDGFLYNPFRKEFLTEYENMLHHFNVRLLKRQDIINIVGSQFFDLELKKIDIYKLSTN